jgi:AraC-like DNA-binding protein
MELLNDLTATGNLEVITVRQTKGMTAEIKKRSSYGLSFCYEGQITYTLDGVDYISDPNCAIILPKERTYSLRVDKSGFFPLINFDCDGFLCDRHIVLPLKNPSALIKGCEYIKKLSLFEKNRPKMMSAFYSLIDGIISQTEESSSVIGGALTYLEANLSDPTLDNEKLAKQANISEVYFRQLFLKQFGITPRQYIINARVAKAKQLLSSGNKKISAVAEECGFQSVYHFCRCFKDRCGMTATEYASLNRGRGL